MSGPVVRLLDGMIREKRPMRVAEMVSIVEDSPRVVQDLLEKLERHGFVQRRGDAWVAVKSPVQRRRRKRPPDMFADQ